MELRFIVFQKTTPVWAFVFLAKPIVDGLPLAKNTLKNYSSDIRLVHKSINRQVKLLVDRNVPSYTV